MFDCLSFFPFVYRFQFLHRRIKASVFWCPYFGVLILVSIFWCPYFGVHILEERYQKNHLHLAEPYAPIEIKGAVDPAMRTFPPNNELLEDPVGGVSTD